MPQVSNVGVREGQKYSKINNVRQGGAKGGTSTDLLNRHALNFSCRTLKKSDFFSSSPSPHWGNGMDFFLCFFRFFGSLCTSLPSWEKCSLQNSAVHKYSSFYYVVENTCFLLTNYKFIILAVIGYYISSYFCSIKQQCRMDQDNI